MDSTFAIQRVQSSSLGETIGATILGKRRMVSQRGYDYCSSSDSDSSVLCESEYLYMTLLVLAVLAPLAKARVVSTDNSEVSVRWLARV